MISAERATPKDKLITVYDGAWITESASFNISLTMCRITSIFV